MTIASQKKIFLRELQALMTKLSEGRSKIEELSYDYTGRTYSTGLVDADLTGSALDGLLAADVVTAMGELATLKTAIDVMSGTITKMAD